MAGNKRRNDKPGGGNGSDSGQPPRQCPICGKPAVAAFHPFSSQRCRDIDLNRWLSDAYAITTDDDDSDGADEQADDGQD